MSRASKITLAATSLTCAATVVWVHYVQEAERAALHEGPKKDAKRMQEKIAANEKKKMINDQEHKLQLELRKKYEAIQPLSGVKVVGEDTNKTQE
ncbi:Pet117 protein [Saccharomycopsis crataegensis]|uniref:Pet117 protein n=1 Tax=Saccharomycopsis crataegensis TaxID=43959 RepID=A0AAV5QF27_9ASCO|nr:Pet117 protein [Saccharomycopsis crataegensis]